MTGPPLENLRWEASSTAGHLGNACHHGLPCAPFSRSLMWIREKASSIRYSKQEHPEDKSGPASDGRAEAHAWDGDYANAKEGAYQALKTPRAAPSPSTPRLICRHGEEE